MADPRGETSDRMTDDDELADWLGRDEQPPDSERNPFDD